MKLSSLSMLKPTLAIAATALCLSYPATADEPKSDAPASASNSTPIVAPATTPVAPINPRVAVIERIAQAAWKAMAKSSDPVALVLSAKYVRDAGLKAGEERTDAQKLDLQSAALAKAKKLSTPQNSGFENFQIAMFCIGFPDKPVCGDRDPVQAFAESAPDNAIGWLAIAGRDYGRGLNTIAQASLEKAAKAKTLVWFYKEGAAVALRYAKAAKDPDTKAGDAEAAAFELLGGMTLPAYNRFSQMCRPDPEGKLPEGRYPLCRKVAQLLIAQGETNVELLVGYRVLERLAAGEKKTDEAKVAADSHSAIQAAIEQLWKLSLKFPPQSAADGAALTHYFDDLVKQGEVSATRLAIKRNGK